MLERSLLELVGAYCFSSGRLADTLRSHLCLRSAGTTLAMKDPLDKLRADCATALLMDLEQRQPRRFRRDDLRRLIDGLTKGSLFADGNLPLLESLSKNLLVRSGEVLHYRDTKVQAYARFAVDLDPCLLAAWHLSSWLDERHGPGPEAIRRLLDHQTPLFAPLPNPVLPHAEGHVHLGGVAAAGLILGGHLMHIRGHEGQRNLPEKRTLLRLRRILSQLLAWSTDRAADPESDFQSRIREICREQPDLSGKTDGFPDWDLLSQLHPHARPGSPEWLLVELAQRAQRPDGLAGCWLWLLVFLLRRYRQPDAPPALRISILYLLIETMHLRRQLVMDDLGLSRFVEDYFANGLRRSGKVFDPLLTDLRHLVAGHGDLLEAKSVPGFFKHQNVSYLASRLGHALGQALQSAPLDMTEPWSAPDPKELGYLQALEQWHFCAHFSRSAKDGRNGQRMAPLMGKLWKQADELQRQMGQTAGWNRPEFLGGRLNPHFRFDPSAWLRGLDVAGNENDLHIEWFAPLLRWLRSGSQPDHQNAPLRTGLHLSIHAGEDYSHPLSGLRHVDETVRFCEMRSGDRLGHALALGIKPKRWAAKHGDMVLSVHEHLDNLVWAWHYASLLSPRLALAGRVLPILERRIRRMQLYGAWLHPMEIGIEQRESLPQGNKDAHAEKLHRWTGPSDHRITPEILFQAWLLRRNCPYQLSKIGDGSFISAKERLAVPDLIRLQQAATRPDHFSPEALYRSRHQQLAVGNASPLLVLVRAQDADHHDSALHEPEVDLCDAFIHDTDSKEELRFMHALQDHLLHIYDFKGLVIEANPTSNVYIARVENHAEHPIFRWSPPDEATLIPGARDNRFGLRSGPIRVLVNTDDPGIMPTTLRTEFALLREAAVQRGIARTTAETWLECLRRYGIEEFHRHHQTVFMMNSNV